MINMYIKYQVSAFNLKKVFFIFFFSMSPSDHSIKVRAQSSIKKGEEISIQYLSFMFGQLRRKKTINSYWHFDCGCPRCQDPTELG